MYNNLQKLLITLLLIFIQISYNLIKFIKDLLTDVYNYGDHF